MEINLIGTLTMFKTMGMIPNFSELARTFGKQSKTCMTVCNYSKTNNSKGINHNTLIEKLFDVC